MRFRKVVTERRKYVRRSGGDAPVAAPERICAGKFADHLPLYRQEQIYAREGVVLSRKTMCGWVWRTADWLWIIYEAIGAENLSNDYMQADETPVRHICPGHSQTRAGHLWVYPAPGRGVFFEWHAETNYRIQRNSARSD
ncbi:MAG TPA: transposase [Kiritimatiellia bacterium]|nr:transposase [Kiritimatiellia bacterium]HRU70080.1 transposase [Kiritimatiellia bacterium]